MSEKLFPFVAVLGFFLGCADIPDELRENASGEKHYCIFPEQSICLSGYFIASECSGELSDKCPYNSSEGCYGVIFNPSKSFCYGDSVFAKCNGMAYNPQTHICQGYSANPAICGGKQYHPLEKEKCLNNVIVKECGTDWYNIATQFCYWDNGDHKISDKCGGKKYDPSRQRCENNVIETKCGTDWYNSEMQFCSGNGILDKCGGKEYNPSEQRCKNNVIETLCGIDWYNAPSDKQYCKNGTTLTQYGSLEYAGQTYRTLEIGEQVWMAENLNYSANGKGKCYGESGKVLIGYGLNNRYGYSDYFGHSGIYITLSDAEIQANCSKYGRLYDWSTAMSVCPPGWHLPSRDEWIRLCYDNMEDNMGGTYFLYGHCRYDFYVQLGGLFDFRYGNNDEDSYKDVGDTGQWWTSTLSDNTFYDGAYSIYLWNNANYQTTFESPNSLLSVRCLQD